MNPSDNNPETLVSVPNDFEAAIIVSALAAHDVDATTSGGFTAGFRAEAPGEVNVIVRRRDLAKARQALSELPVRESSAAPTTQFAAIAPVGAVSFVKMLICLLVAIGLIQSCL